MMLTKNRMALSNKGFTLVELVLAIVIIGVALSGTLMAFNITTRYSADPMLIQQATMIGQAYLEEVLGKDFDPPGTASTNRATHTSIHDYDGWQDIGVRDQTDTSISGLENYTVDISINVTDDLSPLVANTEIKRIDVIVSHTYLNPIVLSSYKANF
ncbi:MAG: pilus assembly protein MshD [Legionellales bacterium]|nr:MAG: pilus assembly protein MshD [Legionellales bacterium]